MQFMWFLFVNTLKWFRKTLIRAPLLFKMLYIEAYFSQHRIFKCSVSRVINRFDIGHILLTCPLVRKVQNQVLTNFHPDMDIGHFPVGHLTCRSYFWAEVLTAIYSYDLDVGPSLLREKK